jgi:hypothetical protein
MSRRFHLAQLNAMFLRAQATDYEVQAIALDDRLLPSERVAKLDSARARSRAAWQTYDAASARYAKDYPPVAIAPFAWLRKIFRRART